ncbi:L-threonylcarbamoyladenylate synthase, partial [Bacteriovoracaceae bacterium]|nr:L-threonylcarbamoyladenylate synthase [Bacteriovoracaceae bacterium]
SFDPLIIHISDREKAKSLAKWNKLANFLAEKFWPGPLTIVAPKTDKVSSIITAGLSSVAIRCPKHTLATSVLSKFTGLAAPSANKFGKTSPTSAEHVEKEFKGKVLVLDGGPCEVGIESTVIGIVSESELAIYRPGMITKETLARVLEDFDRKVLITYTESPVAPGQLKHHYMPDIPLLFNKSLLKKEDILPLAKIHLKQDFKNPVTLILNDSAIVTARELYQQFRIASEANYDLIIVNGTTTMDRDDWRGILNRLEKAASLTV